MKKIKRIESVMNAMVFMTIMSFAMLSIAFFEISAETCLIAFLSCLGLAGAISFYHHISESWYWTGRHEEQDYRKNQMIR